MKSIFETPDSAEEALILATQFFPDENYLLSLRPLSILKDLTFLYEWLQDPDLLTNSRIIEKVSRLTRYYKQSQGSTGRHSLLVERSSEPVCQFDISLINLHELYLRIPTSVGDCILTYLFTAKGDWPLLFKNALRLLLDYYFSFPESRRIWVNVLQNQETLLKLFMQSGFALKSEYTARQQPYVILYMRRTNYLQLKISHPLC